MKWFKHDTDAAMDAKLTKLRMKYGMEGYGLYWYCLELITGRISEFNLTFELEHDAEVLAFHTGIPVARINDIMCAMVDLELFELSDNVITCMSLAKRLDQSMTSNPRMRKLITDMKNHEAIMMESGQGHDGVMTESCKNRTEQNRTELVSVNTDTRAERKRPAAAVPVKKIVDLYHKLLPTLPRVEKITKTREGYIRQRWREDLPSLQHWQNYFEYIRGSPFLMGQTGGKGDKPPFIADLEWITKPANFAKIAEEKYHRG